MGESEVINSYPRPLHTPGSIQPHGAILAVDIFQLKIVQASNNTEHFLGIPASNLLDRNLNCCFDDEQITTLENIWQENYSYLHYLELNLALIDGAKKFHCFVHQNAQGLGLIELELSSPNANISIANIYGANKKAIALLQQAKNLGEFLCVAVEEIRQIIQCDRVLIYQFDSQDAGEVIAEAKKDDLPSYLGLHYPAEDIPQQSREFYKNGLVRFIPQINLAPVEIIPSLNTHTNEPLDLSRSILRSVDSCCVEYHQNMGVNGILILSLLQQEKLWGLIACHHHTAKYIPQEIRITCEFLVEIIASELSSKMMQEELEYKQKLESLRSQTINSISQANNLRDALIHPEPRLLELVGATGAAVCLDEDLTLLGLTPTATQIQELITWANTQVEENLFYTDYLSSIYSQAQAYKDSASGLLLLRISKIRRYYLLWFRREILQTVNWAGNPHIEAIELNPRYSFALWQETVSGKSSPWQRCEIDSALDLRMAIVGIVLNKADELAQINLELERSNRELASFAYAASHDLKEPLRGIHNYSTFLLEDYQGILDTVGIERLETLIRLTQRMEALIDVLLQFSQLGQAQLKLTRVDLNDLVIRVVEILRISHLEKAFDVRLPRILPTSKGDALLLHQVFTNLISNALKYNQSSQPWVEIGYLNEQEQIIKFSRSFANLVFYVRDNGIGIEKHHQKTIFRLFKRLHSQKKYGGGTGAGLTIAQKIIERHGGEIWVESDGNEGSVFYFYFTLK